MIDIKVITKATTTTKITETIAMYTMLVPVMDMSVVIIIAMAMTKQHEL